MRLDVATGALTRFAHDPSEAASLADDRVYVLYLDGKDRLWVGTDAGLDRWDARRGSCTSRPTPRTRRA